MFQSALYGSAKRRKQQVGCYAGPLNLNPEQNGQLLAADGTSVVEGARVHGNARPQLFAVVDTTMIGVVEIRCGNTIQQNQQINKSTPDTTGVLLQYFYMKTNVAPFL